ncbi:MAG: hypothetical protein NTY48_04970 [Candidatus Diapherotrites archaeon]|nr:hypothetical protein [Candidatus Diapherotrites archaeon]
MCGFFNSARRYSLRIIRRDKIRGHRKAKQQRREEFRNRPTPEQVKAGIKRAGIVAGGTAAGSIALITHSSFHKNSSTQVAIDGLSGASTGLGVTLLGVLAFGKVKKWISEIRLRRRFRPSNWGKRELTQNRVHTRNNFSAYQGVKPAGSGATRPKWSEAELLMRQKEVEAAKQIQERNASELHKYIIKRGLRDGAPREKIPLLLSKIKKLEVSSVRDVTKIESAIRDLLANHTQKQEKSVLEKETVENPQNIERIFLNSHNGRNLATKQLRPIHYEELEKLLIHNFGFLGRGKTRSSHRVLVNSQTGKRTVVAGHRSSPEKNVPVIADTLREAGITKEQFNAARMHGTKFIWNGIEYIESK